MNIINPAVIEYTDKIPGSFTGLSCEHYYLRALDTLRRFPNPVIVEVGVDQGRSASLLLQAAQLVGEPCTIVLVDSWESVLIDNMAKVDRLCREFPSVHTVILNAKSTEAAKHLSCPIHMVHIDANHYDDNPANDCAAWLPKLVSGGIACFHDHGSNFIAVTPAVDTYTEGWEDLGVWDSLAIRRKP